ncbi:S-adenosyl-L-methionine-dependent methyltransferase [Daedaleopsis nitida]|nr:S-adenosyl-L-methionine-dependent methyltransferase [Daedaleopsis nitida]
MTPTSEAEKLRNDPAVIKAADYIVSACGQLSNAVHDPFHTLMEALCACHLTASLQVLEAGHIAEILRDAGPGGLHIDEIARQVDKIRAGADGTPLSKPLDPAWLSQILRMLATHEWTREVRPDVFVNNRLSSFLDSGMTLEQLHEAPGSKYDTNPAIAMVPMSSAEPFRTMTKLSEFLLTPNLDPKWENPFNYAYQTEEKLYVWFERPENAYRLKQIGRAMTAGDRAEGLGDITSTSTFPWNNLSSDTLVVDVGGGVGGLSVKLALAHPHLKFIVQDRAQTVAMAPAVWGQQHKEVFASGRLTYQAQDFFDPQPEGLNPGVFVLRRVLHNWPAEACHKILKNLRAAATPDTKLIIIEHILPLACADDSFADGATLAPKYSPLLPNLGKAYAAGYSFSLTMMAMMNGKDRTLREYAELTGAAGWRIERVVRAEGSLIGYMTCVPV